MQAGQTIYIVDDEAVIRASLASLLRARGDLEPREFDSGTALLDSLDALEPGCVILDLQLDARRGGASGVTIMAALADRRSDYPTIIVTGSGDAGAAVAAFKAGAVDFLYKPYEVKPLMAAIDRALHLLRHGSEEPKAAAAARAAMDRLSTAEASLLDHLILGHTHVQIAEALSLDEQGVRMLRARMLATLEAPSLLSAIRIAMMAGVLPG